MNSEPTFPQRQSVDETAAIFRRLRALKASLPKGTNKHEEAVVLITACIEEGLNTRKRIGRGLARIGLDSAHVMIILNEGTGMNPDRHRWSRDGDGVYILLEE